MPALRERTVTGGRRKRIWMELGSEVLNRAWELKGKLETELHSPFWQEVIARPRQLLYWAENLSPELTRRALSYASVARLPGTTGPTFEITDWSQDGLAVALKAPAQSELSMAELTQFAERVLRLYWERHFLGPADQLTLRSAHLEKLGSWSGTLQLRLGMNHLMREKLRIAAARTDGEAVLDISIPVFSEQSLQVGECSFELAWTARPALE